MHSVQTTFVVSNQRLSYRSPGDRGYRHRRRHTRDSKCKALRILRWFLLRSTTAARECQHPHGRAVTENLSLIPEYPEGLQSTVLSCITEVSLGLVAHKRRRREAQRIFLGELFVHVSQYGTKIIL
jgi:hypothetical protein